MRLKKPLIIGASILAVLVLGAWVVLTGLDLNRYKPRVIEAVKNAAGLELAVHGNIEFALGLSLGLLIHDVEIKNADWGSRPEMLTMRRCEVKIALLPLIRGVFVVNRLVLIEPDLLIETDGSGRLNFISTPRDLQKRTPESPPSPREARRLPVRAVRIEKGRFTYRNGRSGATYVKRLDRFTLSAATMRSPVQVDMAGFLKDRPFGLKGRLGTPADLMLGREPWPVDVTAEAEGAVANIRGSVGDAARLKDFLLQIHSEGPSVSKVLALAGIQMRSDLGPFLLTAVFSVPEGVPALKDVDLRIGTQHAVEITAGGSIENLRSMQNMNFRVTASIQGLPPLSRNPRKPPLATGRITVTGSIHDSGPKMLSSHDLRISGGADSLMGTLDVDLSGTKPMAELNLSSPGLEFREVMFSFPGEETLTRLLKGIGPADLTFAIFDPFGASEVQEVDLHLGKPRETQIRVTGRIKSLRTMKGTELNFNAWGEEAAHLEKLLGKPIPVKGPFALSGFVRDLPERGFFCRDLAVTLGENQATGSMELHLSPDGTLLHTVLVSENPDLESIVPTQPENRAILKILDSLGPMKLAVSVAEREGKPAVPAIHARMGTDEEIEVSIQGAIRDVLSRRGLELDLAVHGREFEHLGRLFGKTMPLKGPFSLKGRIFDPEPGVYRLEAVEATVGDNDIRGWAEANVADPLLIEASLASRDVDMGVLPTIHGTGGVLGHIETWSLKTRMVRHPHKLMVEKFDLSLEAPELARADLTGSIQNLFSWQGVEVHISIEGDDLGNLKTFTGKPFPYSGPFALSGRLSDPGADLLQVRDFHALFGNNSLEGAFEVVRSSPRPRLAGAISSDTLDLRPLFSKSSEPGQIKKEPVQGEKSEAKIFPGAPLRLDRLESIDADMHVEAGEILLPRLAVGKATIHVKIDNGRLEVFPLHGAIGGGTADGRFTLKREGAAAGAELEFTTSQVDVGAMLEELGAAKAVEGILRAEIKARATGDSIGELMAGLNGRTVFVLTDGRIYNKNIDLLGGGLVREFYRLITPYSQKEAFSQLTCHANHFDIQDGLAVSKVWVTDTRYTTVRGAGQIDLAKERVDMAFRMSPKKSIGIPGFAEIDVNIGDFARSFKVEGTFAQPSVALDPAGAAATLGKMLGGLALFGPIGLAAGLLDLKLGKDHPCLKAVEALENGPGTAQGESEPAAERSPPPPSQSSEQQQGP